MDKTVQNAHPKKKAHYEEAAKGFKHWLGKKKLEWIDPCRGVYGIDEINVNVNPELGVKIDGVPHLIKLYFKTDKLPKNHATISTHLMSEALSETARPGTIMAVLDTRRGKLNEYTAPHPQLDAALRGELAYINALWGNL